MTLLNAKQTAEYLGNLSVATIYKYSSNGSIPKLKHSGKLLFDKDDLDNFIKRNRVCLNSCYAIGDMK